VPTGWGITLDLLRSLPNAPKDADVESLSAWYEERFGKRPTYSHIVGSLARGPIERRNLLRHYFEPDDEEREQGIKSPSEAHRAIARLVADGFFRVVITTNFDRLLEQSFSELGVTPDVVDGSRDHALCSF
jgi:hypothetical protein